MLVQIEIEAHNIRSLSLVGYRADRISLSTLIDALFALPVIRESKRTVIKEPELLPEESGVESVGHQVAQIRDVVAVPTQELVVTFAIVLLVARITEE